MNKRALIITASVLVVAVGGYFGYKYLTKDKQNGNKEPEKEPEAEQDIPSSESNKTTSEASISAEKESGVKPKEETAVAAEKDDSVKPVGVKAIPVYANSDYTKIYKTNGVKVGDAIKKKYKSKQLIGFQVPSSKEFGKNWRVVAIRLGDVVARVAVAKNASYTK